MDTRPNYTRIATDETLKETIPHGSAEFPFSYYLEDIWDFDFHCVDWHWHPELEFVLLRKGSCTAMVGSDRFELKEGQALFVNTRVIHRFDSTDHAVIPNILFSPTLLAGENSVVFQKYIYPLLCSSLQYLVFTPEIRWQREIISILRRIFIIHEGTAGSELTTLRLILELWEILARNTASEAHTESTGLSSGKQAQLQIMMQFIQSNYSKPITLDDIAASVSISKSSALKLFDQFIHTSPKAYLLRYRLQSAAGLLVNTEQAVANIAQATGFTESAYFCRRFKNLYGMTPSEYRIAKRRLPGAANP